MQKSYENKLASINLWCTDENILLLQLILLNFRISYLMVKYINMAINSYYL